MFPYLTIFAVLATVNGHDFVNLVDELLKDGGHWILASVGTTGVEPPNEGCVHVTITDTAIQSQCILVNYNHTPHPAKIIEFYGINENKRIEIISLGPVHQYMIKGYLDPNNIHEALNSEVNWDAALHSPMCYNPITRNIHDFRYVIAPIDKTVQHILLVGVRKRMPSPEYQVAILTKTKLKPDHLDQITHDVNHRNFLSMNNNCMMAYQKQKSFPTNRTLPPFCLPSLHKRCAEGVHWQYNSEVGKLIISPNNTELETILVKHLA